MTPPSPHNSQGWRARRDKAAQKLAHQSKMAEFRAERARMLEAQTGGAPYEPAAEIPVESPVVPPEAPMVDPATETPVPAPEAPVDAPAAVEPTSDEVVDGAAPADATAPAKKKK